MITLEVIHQDLQTIGYLLLGCFVSLFFLLLKR
jgi:hypothetical protein